MAFRITMTEEAERHFQGVSARDRRTLQDAVAARLLNQPTTLTRAVKRLRPNPLAEFELRAGNLRVLYNVEGDEVILLVIGRKVGNKLIVAGEEFHGHQDHPSEPTGNGPAQNAE